MENHTPQYKQARAIADMTQGIAADKLGVAPSTLLRWEADETMPNASQIVAMAKLYGVSCDQLLGLKPLVAQD